MSATMQLGENKVEQQTPAWGAVYAMGLCVAGLITAEMLPISLLTSIAGDLHISEGLAGQTVTATAAIAFLSSLLIAVVTRSVDRRNVLLAFSGLLVVSSLMVAFAPGLPMLLAGRVLLGLAIGGFWALSTAMAMRLVPPADIPKALAIVFGAVALASVVAPPLGSFFGALIGWRNIFIGAAALGFGALLWQAAVLPAMPSSGQTRLSTLFHVLTRREVWPGMACVLLNFAAQFSFFTYLRPFLETVTHLGPSGISAVLLGSGIASFIGTSIAGRLIARSLNGTISMAPVLMGVAMVGLLTLGGNPWVTGLSVMLWGVATATVPVAWSTWLTRTVPDEAETGGGLMVATMQLAIMAGAASGGVAMVNAGPTGAFALALVLFIVTTAATAFALRARRAAAIA